MFFANQTKRWLSGSFLIAACAFAHFATAQDPPAGKSPVPAQADVDASAKDVREVFRDAFAPTAKPTAKVAASQKMLEMSRERGNTEPGIYALLTSARDLAVEAGDVDALEAALRELDAKFVVNASAMRLTAYTTFASRTNLSPAARTAIVRAGLAAVDDAYRRGDLLPAAGLLKRLDDVADGADDRTLPDEIASRRKTGSQLYEQQKAVEPALAAVKAMTATPQQKADAGRFLAFARGDWKAGMELLSQGDDEALKKIADADRANPAAANDQAALADLWWTYAESAPEWQRAAIQGRASQLYRAALPGLNGLAKLRAEKRVQSAPAAPAADSGEGSSTAGSAGILADKVVLWNFHNGRHRDRGAKTAHVTFFFGPREVAKKTNVEIPWSADKCESVEIAAPAEPFDRLRVELPDWRGTSAGLCEIEVFKGDKNLALQAVALASNTFLSGEANEDLSALTVIDGITDTGDQPRYWVLDDRTPGAIELEWTPVVNAAALSKALGYPLRRHPTSAISFKGHWYAYFAGRILWSDAHKKCQQLGGHLLIVNSVEENVFCYNLAKKRRFWGGGLRDPMGRFRWVDGTAIALPGWIRGQPDNFNGREDRLEITKDGWNDVGGDWDNIRGFICEWPF